MPAAPPTATDPASTDRVPSWTVTVRPSDAEPWVVTLLGPITSSSTAVLAEMTEWVGALPSVDRVVLDLWAADVQPDAGGIAALTAPSRDLAQLGVHVHIRGAEPCWRAQLAPLVAPDTCSFE
jgi:hypothetical protein